MEPDFSNAFVDIWPIVFAAWTKDSRGGIWQLYQNMRHAMPREHRTKVTYPLVWALYKAELTQQ